MIDFKLLSSWHGIAISVIPFAVRVQIFESDWEKYTLKNWLKKLKWINLNKNLSLKSETNDFKWTKTETNLKWLIWKKLSIEV